jgi:hypothetical protein
LSFLAGLIWLLAGARGPAAAAAHGPSQTLPVFIFAGQSNMIVSKTDAAELTPEQRLPQSQVLFYGPDEHGSTWAPLQPPTTSDGGFGPEVSAGAYLTQFEEYPMVAEVKLAISGSNLANEWNPDAPGSYYHQLLTRVQTATVSLQAQYPADDIVIAGFFWMQGEADADNGSFAAAYETNLNHFIDRVRADYGDPNLPFIIGRIRVPSYPFSAQVRAAQKNVADTKPWVALVNTDYLTRNPDYVHFDSPSTYQLGRLFANAFILLTQPAGPYLPLLAR